MERTVYEPRPAGDGKRNFEWVELPEGSVCMWSMSMAEAANISRQAKTPRIGDQGGGIDETMSGALEVMFCAYNAEPGSEKPARLFSNIQQVYELPFTEFRALLEAGMRANGKSPEQLKALEDFTEARQAEKSAS